MVNYWGGGPEWSMVTVVDHHWSRTWFHCQGYDPNHDKFMETIQKRNTWGSIMLVWWDLLAACQHGPRVQSGERREHGEGTRMQEMPEITYLATWHNKDFPNLLRSGLIVRGSPGLGRHSVWRDLFMICICCLACFHISFSFIHSNVLATDS